MVNQHNLKNKATAELNRLVQDFVVPRKQSRYCVGMLL